MLHHTLKRDNMSSQISPNLFSIHAGCFIHDMAVTCQPEFTSFRQICVQQCSRVAWRDSTVLTRKICSGVMQMFWFTSTGGHKLMYSLVSGLIPQVMPCHSSQPVVLRFLYLTLIQPCKSHIEIKMSRSRNSWPRRHYQDWKNEHGYGFNTHWI